jgi:hypothetical protein
MTVAKELNGIWKSGLAYRQSETGKVGFPGLTDTQTARARELFAELRETDTEEAIRANAAYRNRGINLGDNPPLPRAQFSGEWREDLPPFQGYDSGERWNGWAAPLLPLDQVLIVIQEQKAIEGQEGAMGLSMDGETLIAKYSEDDETARIEGEMHETEDGPKHLYPVGFGWIWDRTD